MIELIKMKERVFVSAKLSVIIPVHNSEAYIESCVDSIRCQDYEDIEILLIDNNSSDSSLDICKQLMNEDQRIFLYKQNISGAAAARNLGIEKATGEYISFADSDDYLEENAYRIMMNKILEDDSEMVICSYKYVDSDRNDLRWYVPRLSRYIKNGPISGKDACKIFLTSRDIEGFGWNKVFKREIWNKNGLRFEESKTAFEDMATVFKVMAGCNRISFVEQKLYNYVQRTDSLVHQAHGEKKSRDYEDSMREIKECAFALGLKREAESSIIYRSVLLHYDRHSGLNLGFEKFVNYVYLIFRYQRTEKIKTIAKLFMVNIWK